MASNNDNTEDFFLDALFLTSLFLAVLLMEKKMNFFCLPLLQHCLRRDPIMFLKKPSYILEEEMKRINIITFLWGSQNDSICWEKMTDKEQ